MTVRATTRHVGLLVLAAALTASLVATVSPAPAWADGISRLAGDNRYDTAVRISRATFGRDVASAWVVSGTDFPDALAAAAIAGRDGVPVLPTKAGAVPTLVLDELRRLRPGEIRIAGGTAAVTREAEAQLAAIAPVVRSSGGNRYATAADVSRRFVDPGVDRVFVASGTTFPDALAAAPLAAAWGGPVLLTHPDRLPAATSEELGRLAPDRIVVVGGERAVSPEVAAAMEQVAEVRRLSDTNRYGTAARVARAFPTPQPTVHVASGQAFADALAIAPVAGMATSPVLLTSRTRLPAQTAGALDRLDPDDVVVVGGPAAVDRGVSLALASHARLPAWSSSVSDVTAARLGVSWQSGCPLAPSRLRLVTLPHVGFDGQVRTGQLIVHQRVVDEVQDAFRVLYQARFPIRRMRTVEQYGASDRDSMADDNTSAFNCRVIAGTSSWSRHAYGLAIDINPIENPWRRGTQVSPPAGRAWLDRDDERPGMLLDGSPEVAAFTSRGFRWGGDWSSPTDWQHVDQAP